MTHYETWVSYSGSARIWLAVGLLAAGGAIAYTGTRLPLPVRATRPGKAATSALLWAWAASIVALLACADIYYRRYLDAYHLTFKQAVPPERVFPVTLAAAVVVLIVVAMRSPDESRPANAVIAAITGPVIFELPFDLIVLTRIYPPVPPDPALYRALIFAPLFLVEITTLLLLRLSPMVRLTRATFFFFALMLGVWAVWALTGFGYPSAPAPYALNVVSKLLAFATALTLFLSRQACASGVPGAAGDSLPDEVAQ